MMMGPVTLDQRFEILAGIGNLAESSLLEVGCGRGEFLDWLLRNYRDIDYCGMAEDPIALDQARRRFPAASFLHGSPEEPPESARCDLDWIFLRPSAFTAGRSIEDSVRTMLDVYFPRCRRGLALDLPSAWTNGSEAVSAQIDPLQLIQAARPHTTRVAMRQEGQPAELTLFLYR